MTRAAGARLSGRRQSAELRLEAVRAHWIEEQLFAQIALGVGDGETRINRAVGQRRLRQVFIARRHAQLIEAANASDDGRPERLRVISGGSRRVAGLILLTASLDDCSGVTECDGE